MLSQVLKTLWDEVKILQNLEKPSKNLWAFLLVLAGSKKLMSYIAIAWMKHLVSYLWYILITTFIYLQFTYHCFPSMTAMYHALRCVLGIF